METPTSHSMHSHYTVQALHEYVAYSPMNPAPIAETLRGVWTLVDGGSAYVCRTCLGRLIGRGVSISVDSHVWYDRADPYGRCVGCELAIVENKTI